METMIQPKITGYRQLTEAEVELMNEAKALAEQCGAFIKKVRDYPHTIPGEGPTIRVDAAGKQHPTIDHRWTNIGATQLQQGWMAVIRGIAQPTTF